MFIELGVEEQDSRFTKYICEKWIVFKTENSSMFLAEPYFRLPTKF